MHPVQPPFSRSLRPQVELEAVPADWLRERFGAPAFHESDSLAVLSPTDYWAFRLSTGTTVVLSHMPAANLLLVETDSSDIGEVLADLGLEGFSRNVVRPAR